MSEINYVRVGSGDPLVLLHGIGSRWQVWEPLFDALTPHFDVIALDLPGFGASPANGSTSVAALTDQVSAFLAYLGLDRPHLAGNSMGGAIALALGGAGRAKTVTAFSPIGFWSAPGRIWCQQTLGRMHRLGGMLRPALPTLLGNAVGRTVLFGLLSGRPWAVEPQLALDTAVGVLDSYGFDESLDSFAEQRITAITGIPVTIAWGSRDIVLTYATQHRRARMLAPEAKHVTLRGCGHVPFFDDPTACAGLLLDHIQGRKSTCI